jgi:hypothetical protein
VCGLDVRARCIELYDRVERDGRIATAAITFADGAVTVRARRGSDPLIVPGTRSLAELLAR